MLKYLTVVVGMMQSNCHIIYNDITLEAVIIDPGDEANKIISAVDNLSLKPRLVILTHGHFDHISATDEICLYYNIGVVININDKDFLTNGSYNLSSVFFNNEITVNAKDVTYVSNEKMDIIGEEFEFITTPGHTNGSMCIKVCDILITGDTLFYMSIGNSFPPFGDMQKEISSIKNSILSLDGDYVCLTGHGQSTTLSYEKANNQYLR